MAVRTSAVTTKTVKSGRRASWLFATKAWRLGFVALLGVGLWLGLRWITGTLPPLHPSLSAFMADGGGGAVDVRGVYATAEYFRLTERDPATLGLNPEREQIFFVIAETHEHDFDLPSPDTWWGGISLSINGQGDYHPMKQKAVLTSEHHQTVAVAFQPRGEDGELLSPPDEGVLALAVPNLGDGARFMQWHLPLSTGSSQRQGSSPLLVSLWAFFPLIGGLLVAFSPCFIHMGTYYAPLFGALQEKKLAGVMKVRAAGAAGLFALGFTIPYSLAGIAVGYAGQFTKNAPLLAALSQPVTFVAGAAVIYFGLQAAGIFQLPFLLRLRLPTVRPGLSGFGYLSSVLLGLNLAVGCLGCVGGSLFAGMLLYSGAVGSPLEGGLTLFLFGLAANAPFFLAAMTLGHLQLRWFVPLRVTRYIPLASGVILITLGLLILSGTESIVEDALLQAVGITG